MNKSIKYKEVLNKYITINKSDGLGLFQLGLMHLYGKGYPQDIKKGISLIEKAANHYPFAYTFLGISFLKGKVVRKNKKKGLAYLKKAKFSGDSEALVQLSYLYLDDVTPDNYEKAIQLLSEAVDKGHPLAMLYKGIFLITSPSSEESYRKAYELFALADELKNYEATAFLGHMYENGYFVEKSISKAFRYYLKGTSGGSAFAHYFLANMYREGTLGEINIDEAIRHYEYASVNGFLHAMHELIDIYFDKGSSKYNLLLGRAYLDKLLEINDPIALYKYGYFLVKGLHFTKNIKLGLKYLRKSNYKESYLYLGKLYSLGSVVPWNRHMALDYFLEGAKLGCADSMIGAARILTWSDFKNNPNREKLFSLIYDAIELGNKDGYYLLGRCYQYGIDVEVDYQKAKEYYLLAGDQFAYQNVALFYLKGWGFEKDVQTGISYLKKGVEKGSVSCSNMLAYIYTTGEDIPQDLDEAEKYLHFSASNGYIRAYYNLAKIYLEKDKEKGLEYLLKAVELKDIKAIKLYNELKEKGEI